MPKFQKAEKGGWTFARATLAQVQVIWIWFETHYQPAFFYAKYQ